MPVDEVRPSSVNPGTREGGRTDTTEDAELAGCFQSDEMRIEWFRRDENVLLCNVRLTWSNSIQQMIPTLWVVETGFSLKMFTFWRNPVTIWQRNENINRLQFNIDHFRMYLPYETLSPLQSMISSLSSSFNSAIYLKISIFHFFLFFVLIEL